MAAAADITLAVVKGVPVLGPLVSTVLGLLAGAQRKKQKKHLGEWLPRLEAEAHRLSMEPAEYLTATWLRDRERYPATTAGNIEDYAKGLLEAAAKKGDKAYLPRISELDPIDRHYLTDVHPSLILPVLTECWPTEPSPYDLEHPDQSSRFMQGGCQHGQTASRPPWASSATSSSPPLAIAPSAAPSTPAPAASGPSGPTMADWSSILGGVTGALGGLGDLLGVPGLSSLGKIASTVTTAIKPAPRPIQVAAPAVYPPIPSVPAQVAEIGGRVAARVLPASARLLGPIGTIKTVADTVRAKRGGTEGVLRTFYPGLEYIEDLTGLGPGSGQSSTAGGAPPALSMRRNTMAQYGPSSVTMTRAYKRHMGGAMANDQAGNPICFPGYHISINRQGVVQCTVNRRMNPFNPRALSRAARRISSFSRHVKKYVQLVHPHRTVKVNPFRHHRRKKCCK